MSHANNSINYNFSGAKVLVTGGTSGIGLAIANAFVEAGADVSITGTRGYAADYACDLSRFDYHPMQAQDRQQIEAVAAGLDRLDILVNNAGAVFPEGKDEFSPEGFELALRINLMSAQIMSRACFDKLKASQLAGGASVIGIASLTSFAGNPLVPGYGAAKAGLVQFAKTLAVTWAKQGIRANNVAAGLVASRMTQGTDTPSNHIDDFNRPMIERTPQQRWGMPDDIAAVVLFLASRSAGFITGETILVDGGYSAVC